MHGSSGPTLIVAYQRREHQQGFRISPLRPQWTEGQGLRLIVFSNGVRSAHSAHRAAHLPTTLPGTVASVTAVPPDDSLPVARNVSANSSDRFIRASTSTRT